MRKANISIRTHASQSGIYLYEIAARLGMNDGNFSRLLRFELPEHKKVEIITIINELSLEHSKKKDTL